jgi:hypothetical protein
MVRMAEAHDLKVGQSFAFDQNQPPACLVDTVGMIDDDGFMVFLYYMTDSVLHQHGMSHEDVWILVEE